MKSVFLFSLLLFSISVFAQDDTTWKEPSKESQAYHKYRQHLSYPPYSFEKINQIVRKQVVTDSEDNLVMKSKAYEALSPGKVYIHNDPWRIIQPKL